MNMYKTFNIIAICFMIILSMAATALSAWQVNIEVSTPDTAADTGLAVNNLNIGTDPDATDDYDNKFDTIALLNGPIHAYFTHEEYSSDKQKLWRDIRSELIPQEWTLEVQSEINKTVNIKWQSLPSNLKLILIDQDTQKEFVMTSLAEHSYTNTTTTPKSFLLKASESTGGAFPNQQSSGGGGTKGGGCGYIRNMGGIKKTDRGQIVQSIMILLLPMLLPLKNSLRKNAK